MPEPQPTTPATPRRLHADPPLQVALVEPQIPPNAGNVARLCAATRCHLVLAGALGFAVTDAQLKRAGLDYWAWVSWELQPDLEAWAAALPAGRVHLLTRHARVPYTQIPVQRGDTVLFGAETRGLPPALLERYAEQCYTIPMAEPRVRSLNLSSAVAAVVYDLLRRLEGF